MYFAHISPRNIFKAFKANACLHPATSKPVSSRFVMLLDAALAAFHQVVPQSPTSLVVCMRVRLTELLNTGTEICNIPPQSIL